MTAMHIDHRARKCGWWTTLARLIAACTAALAFIAAALPAEAQDAAAGIGEYHLAPGDTLNFDILSDTAPMMAVTVGADGSVLLPLVGEVTVGDLTLARARIVLRDAYRAGGFLTDPKIGLSLAAFGDIYVTGDVRNPGAFPYRPQINVEQAVALAGGYATLFSPMQSAVLQIAGLQHDLLDAAADIRRLAIISARFKAQFDTRRTIGERDIPPQARPFLEADDTDALGRTETRILDILVQGYQDLRATRVFTIEETERGLELLEQRLEKQDMVVDFVRQDMEQQRLMIEQRRRAPSETSDLERQLISEEAISLSILAQISAAKTRINAERSELALLDSHWQEDALTQMRDTETEMERLISLHQATAEQLALQTGIAAQTSETAQEFTPKIMVRRNRGPDGRLEPADALTALAPGDVIVVTLEGGLPPLGG